MCMQCFFPQNIIDSMKTPMFILNAAYDVIEISLSLAPDRADPSGSWRACNASQMNFLQGFRDQMVSSVQGFSKSWSNRLFISSCFARCQSEQLPGTLYQGIAKSVGNWYYNRAEVKEFDCRYPCDNACHHIM